MSGDVRNVGYCARALNVGAASVDGPGRLRYFASEQRVVEWSGGPNGNVRFSFCKVEQLVANDEFDTKVGMALAEFTNERRMQKTDADCYRTRYLNATERTIDPARLTFAAQIT